MMNIGGIFFNGSARDGIRQDANQAQAWFAKAQSCDASASAGIRDKAAWFREKAARGELPVFVESRKGAVWPGLSSSASSDTNVVTVGLVVLMAGAILADLAHGPYTGQNARGKSSRNEAQEAIDNDRWRAKSACLTSVALGGTLRDCQ